MFELITTSIIFEDIVIEDPEKIERFLCALESSEKAVKSCPPVKNSNILILRDPDHIRQLLESRN